MSTRTLGPERRPPSPSPDLMPTGVVRRGYLGIGAVCVLLLVEVLALAVWFDVRLIQAERGVSGASGPLAGVSGIESIPQASLWELWLTEDQSRRALRLGIVVGAATLIFGSRRLREELSRLTGLSPGRWSWPVFLGHLVALAAFAWLTEQVFEGPTLPRPWVQAWFVAWVALGLAALTLLMATALPPSALGPVARLGLRALAVGLVIGLAAAGAGRFTRMLWMPLARGTLETVHSLLGVFCTDLVYQPDEFLIGTKTFTLIVAPRCSGYEGIGLVLTFLAAYLWFFRRRLRFPQAWLLLPLGAGVIWLANAVRIAALIGVGTCLSEEVAWGGFHSQAGWLAFNVVSLGLILLAQRCRFFRRDEGPQAVSAVGLGPSREAVYLAPLLSIVAVAMISGAFSAGGLDRYYPARLAAVAVPLWWYRREYAAMRWSCSWQALAIGVLVFALWVARWPQGGSGSALGTTASGSLGNVWIAAWLLARVIGSVLTVPLAEELAFRGFLTRRLIAADFDSVPPGRFTWPSFVISSVAFGVLHDRWLEGTMAGILYALAYYRRGSLGDAVAAHATTNAMLSADALMTGDWSLFS